ncbi:MAG: short-chain fatty acyl-CoA regulator family protein [Pseudomonadota bacterium]
MAQQKLYAGAKLREFRNQAGLTQKDFAERLGLSVSYLNQMENNNRPLATGVVLSLASEFGFDVRTLSSGDTERLVVDLREALADPVIPESPALADLSLVASNAPSLARSFLALHKAYRETHERLASLDEAIGEDERRTGLTPWEEVRDFFHYCDNYIDAVDRAAERTASDVSSAVETLERNGITLRLEDTNRLRHFSPATNTLTLSRAASPATQAFQLRVQQALLTQNELLDATLDLARFSSEEARGIAKIGLANYFAGAAQMPYGAFHELARRERHDLERLARAFGASIEQVAHRLSTLQRTGNKGVPFFFVRVDRAGTITKRHSATRLQFARFGGACPLWNVHRAFETPGQFLRQLAETPDGVRYISLARDVSKPGGSYRAPTRRYAIALGCEVKHAEHLVYADGLDVSQPKTFEPIGISCRICERNACHQRSVPPLEGRLQTDANTRDVLPYGLKT